MAAQPVPGSPAEAEHFTISFAGFNRPWAAWIGHRLERSGHRVTLQRWDPPVSVPLRQALRDLLRPSGRVLLVLSDWYFSLGPRTDEEWNAALREVVEPDVHRFAAVSVTTRALPTASAVLEPVDLWAIGSGEAERRVMNRLGLPARRGRQDGDRTGPRFPNDPPEVWGGVPRRNTRFTGRDLLLGELHDRFTTAASGAAVCALLGMSGVGKTQLAAEYAYRFASDYDLVWWVPAEQRGTMRERLAELAPALDLPTGPEYGERIRAVQEALRRGDPHARWLLVFDGADEPENVADLLPTGPGHVLITSRNREWTSHNVTQLDTPVYSREESVAFVRRRARRLTPHDADQLAEALEDIPLLLDQTAGWLGESTMPIAEYVEMVRKGPGTQVGMRTSPEYPMTFQTAWSILLNNLKESVPEAVELLRLCAFFAPGPIPLRLLREVPAKGLPEQLGWLMNDPLRWNAALSRLVQYSVVRVEYQQAIPDEAGTGIEAVQMHRMVHAIVRYNMAEEDRDTLSRVVRQSLAAADPGRPSDSRLWARYAELIPHLEPSGALGSTDPRTQVFVLNCLRYLYLRGEYSTGLQLCELTRRLWREHPDETHPRIWDLTHHHVNTLRGLGRYREAEKLDRDAVARLGAERQTGDLELLRAMTGLAADLRALAEYAEARELSDEVWRGYLELLGEDEPRTLSAMNNLALSLRLEGRFQSALDLDRATFSARERVLRARHIFTLASSTRCAWGLRLLGRYREALSMQELGVRLHRQVLGRTHPQTLRAEHNLALCMRRTGDVAAGEALMRSVRERVARVMGPDHPEALLVAADYANFLREHGDLVEARRLSEYVTGRYRDALGPAHPYAVGASGNLGLVLRASGEREEALRLAEKSLIGMREAVGPDHPWTLGCALNVAGTRNLTGDLDGAAELSRDTLRQARSVLGFEHPLTTSCAVGLAADLRSLRQRDEATKVEDDALQRMSRTLGEQHPHTVSARTRVRPFWDFEPQPT